MVYAVADAQHRHTEVEHRLRRLRGLFLIYRVGPAGEDDAGRVERANIRFAHVPWMEFAIHMCLAHAARDQLGVLGTEVEDEDFFMHSLVGNKKGG